MGGLLFKDYMFRIVCIGPELNENLLKLKGEELEANNLIFEFHKKIWFPNPTGLDWIDNIRDAGWKYQVLDENEIEHTPNIIIGVHAGLSVKAFQAPWAVIMEFALTQNVPIVFTEQSEWSYYAMIRPFIKSGYDDFSKDENENRKLTMIEQKNPFHVIHPNEDINCLMLHNEEGFRALDLRNSYLCGIVPKYD